MKVLWLNHRDPKHPRAGGAERTIYEVSKRLIEKGNTVTLYCPRWKGSLKEETLDGIKIIRNGSSFSIHLILPIFLIKNNFDVIINDLAHGVPWISTVFLSKHNIAFFRHLHARSLPGQVNMIIAKIITFLEKIYPYIYRNVKVITESDSSFHDLKELGFEEKNIIKIPPGVDLNLFHPGPKAQNVQLIYFGGLRKYKRPEYALNVYRDLKNDIPNLKLIVTGNGPQLDKMKEEVRKENYNIEFLGKVDYIELANLIRESWVNLHFSVTEGWGYSILESSASGTPTIALNVPGVLDTIKAGINGFLVSDISDFKEKISYTIKNEEYFIKNSRKFAKNFTWDKTSQIWDQTLKMYEQKYS